MTTEPEATYDPPAPFPEAGYIVFGIPDVPFSSVRLPLVWDINEMNVLVAQAMETAKLVREAYQETFGQPTPAPARSSAAPAQQAPQRAAPARPVTPRATGGLDPDLIVVGTCPEHGCNALPSILKYQEIEMGDDGVERYAKYYCDGKLNGTNANHSLWARELVVG